ncbi:MAG: hypothetical protein GTO55_02745 [Armatimonadetes bacterium]|nr:hypothetical protein [Armatimonadota bacterium]NIM23195.1 hypothetical protein [Armatimonadota bacterium]NIM67063.1 hypothetical protein [Armatimonadota bacterium]NIM75597.1 hypothetical protein [Armatimonadota bacterium]NIN05252.1 hypothetical protein [Armatimonadota bacterium]
MCWLMPLGGVGVSRISEPLVFVGHRFVPGPLPAILLAEGKSASEHKRVEEHVPGGLTHGNWLAEMKFIADSMVGSLARWLRAMGQDVVYDPFMPDSMLMRRAREEGRILLTRDTRLLLVKDVPAHLFISHDGLEEQLAQVISTLGLNPKEEEFLTRCMECNGLLESVEKEAIRGRVYPYVYATQENFQECPDCRRLYWGGTHLPRLKEKLQRLLRFAREKER